MAETVEDVARAAIAAVNSDISRSLVAKFVADRWRQLASRARLRSLRRVGTLTVPAAITTGAISCTRGATTVTLDATALAAVTAAIVGRQIRLRTAWYNIVHLNIGASTLTIDSEYAEDTVTAASYAIVPRAIKLPSDVLHVGDMLFARQWRKLKRISMGQLNTHAPSRPLVSGGPQCYSEIDPHLDGTKQVELYPPSSTTEHVHYVYWSVPPQLDIGDPIPPYIPTWVLKEGALIDLYRYEASKAANAGQIEAAGYWRNEARAQKTQWDTKEILEAIRHDTGTDDITFIAGDLGISSATFLDGDVMSAWDHVWYK